MTTRLTHRILLLAGVLGATGLVAPRGDALAATSQDTAFVETPANHAALRMAAELNDTRLFAELVWRGAGRLGERGRVDPTLGSAAGVLEQRAAQRAAQGPRRLQAAHPGDPAAGGARQRLQRPGARGRRGRRSWRGEAASRLESSRIGVGRGGLMRRGSSAPGAARAGPPPALPHPRHRPIPQRQDRCGPPARAPVAGSGGVRSLFVLDPWALISLG